MKPAATELSMIPVKQLDMSFFTKTINRIPTSCLETSWASRSQLQVRTGTIRKLTFSYRSALSPNAAKIAVVQASSLACPAKLKNASVEWSISWNPIMSMSASGDNACPSCSSVPARQRRGPQRNIHAKDSLHLSPSRLVGVVAAP